MLKNLIAKIDFDKAEHDRHMTENELPKGSQLGFQFYPNRFLPEPSARVGFPQKGRERERARANH